ncbi:helix-turn-helix transcriptional regulator [Brevibacillus sp. SYP-B805]|uniref:helix-turn-helix domain-containing protein n=1 Tax=Brevibacillus sp. SYP-B805 TaxID=1578199 RepID=UPI0013E9A30B|nr:helix-turn-helix transcriptional regulator [Brevibacillus sp. SYP-B805]NGQ94517.1 helix-turn-helix transcriptional regulator [Brevibacillus sp. SYP-B805]
MDIRSEFGQRIRELRARSGMSQEMLAYRTGLDRTYISGVERGERNISLVNIEKIAAALQVSVAYLFSNERFSATPAYQPKEFTVPFLERFQYKLDHEKKILAFTVSGLLTGKDVDHMNATLMGICSVFGKGELTLFVDHRDMKASDGEPAVYSPEVAERAVVFQQNLLRYSSRAVVLCNSEFQVQQLNHVTRESGIPSIHLYGQDKEMVGRAYELLGIHGNELIKAKK